MFAAGKKQAIMHQSGSNWKIPNKAGMEQLAVVRCTIDDLQQYQFVARQTFFETYETGTDPGDLEKYIQEHFSTEAIIHELGSDHCTVFLLKDKDQGILG